MNFSPDMVWAAPEHPLQEQRTPVSHCSGHRNSIPLFMVNNQDIRTLYAIPFCQVPGESLGQKGRELSQVRLGTGMGDRNHAHSSGLQTRGCRAAGTQCTGGHCPWSSLILWGHYYSSKALASALLGLLLPSLSPSFFETWINFLAPANLEFKTLLPQPP